MAQCRHQRRHTDVPGDERVLVRELIEQLAEMPPDLPVCIVLPGIECVQVDGAFRAGRQTGPVALLTVDQHALSEATRDYLLDKVNALI